MYTSGSAFLKTERLLCTKTFLIPTIVMKRDFHSSINHKQSYREYFNSVISKFLDFSPIPL